MIIYTSFENTGVDFPTGETAACCVNIIDCGFQKNTMGKPQHKVAFVFELNSSNENGEHLLITKVFTASMFSKSNLRPFVEQWRGRPYNDEEVEAFNTDVLLGKYVILNLQKKKNNAGKEFTEIFGIRHAPASAYFTEIQHNGVVPKWIQTMIDEQLPPPEERAPQRQKAEPPIQMQFGGDSQNFPDDIPF